MFTVNNCAHWVDEREGSVIFLCVTTEKYCIIFLLLKGAALDWHKICYTKLFIVYANFIL